MKVLLVTQYFYPETFKSNDIAFELSKRGHEVTVLTGIPNYPQGKYYKGYGIFKKRREKINNVPVIRSFLIPRGKGGGISLGLNYMSWAIAASLRAFFLALFNKYDAIVVHETSPITVGFPAIVVKKIRKIPIYFWVLDLWPESLTSAGDIHNPKVLSFFTKITQYIYKNSDKILMSSRGFKKSILEKGDFEDKLIYFPNWAENIFDGKNTGISIPKLPEGFIVMFAGNIGEAQDFDTIMQAALLLKEEKDIHFVFLGDGRKKPWVEDFLNQNGLQNTVHLLGRHPLDSMPSFFKKADAMLVTLKDELIFNLTVPAKLQAYMMAGKPIIAMLNGEGAEIVKEAYCGVTVNSGNHKKLAEQIVTIKNFGKRQLNDFGVNGKKYCTENFSLDKSMDHLESILSSTNKS